MTGTFTRWLRQDYRNPILSVYVPAQIKLVMRMAKQRHRKAHKVAVQVTAPNGFNDRSKTGMIANWSWPSWRNSAWWSSSDVEYGCRLPRISGHSGAKPAI